jgi:hypothetical protein
MVGVAVMVTDEDTVSVSVIVIMSDELRVDETHDRVYDKLKV